MNYMLPHYSMSTSELIATRSKISFDTALPQDFFDRLAVSELKDIRHLIVWKYDENHFNGKPTFWLLENNCLSNEIKRLEILTGPEKEFSDMWLQYHSNHAWTDICRHLIYAAQTGDKIDYVTFIEAVDTLKQLQYVKERLIKCKELLNQI
jgi:hypothetical protein